jgi:hypothetical protein
MLRLMKKFGSEWLLEDWMSGPRCRAMIPLQWNGNQWLQRTEQDIEKLFAGKMREEDVWTNEEENIGCDKVRVEVS